MLAQITAATTGDSTILWIVIAIVVVLAIVLAVVMTRRRSEKLRERFGPEYTRTLQETGDKRAAEKELAARTERYSKLKIVPLPPGARDRYAEEWRVIQMRFTDDPKGAIRDADRLVTAVMRDRGYPMDDIEQRIADVSVEHASVAQDYREAHRISIASEGGDADTEALRRAMIHYRNLFEDLLETNRTRTEAGS